MNKIETECKAVVREPELGAPFVNVANRLTTLDKICDDWQTKEFHCCQPEFLECVDALGFELIIWIPFYGVVQAQASDFNFTN